MKREGLPYVRVNPRQSWNLSISYRPPPINVAGKTTPPQRPRIGVAVFDVVDDVLVQVGANRLLVMREPLQILVFRDSPPATQKPAKEIPPSEKDLLTRPPRASVRVEREKLPSLFPLSSTSFWSIV
mmetsp:Transcript_12969/g.55352  ORF Transcript_12969/g.55352 Transcript_12969/m.55352 type:complete len:127 (-) Transcript_12969:1308-1688(-)